MTTSTPGRAPGSDLPSAARLAMAACAVLGPALVIFSVLLHRDLAGAGHRAYVTAVAADVDAFTPHVWLAPVATLEWAIVLLGFAGCAWVLVGGRAEQAVPVAAPAVTPSQAS